LNILVGNKKYSIPLENLYIKKEQYYKFPGQGISKMKQTTNNDEFIDIYDLSSKSDIIIKIQILM
jgi:hypothetical protein